MTHDIKQFKRPPKRHQPRGLEILYEDRDIIVVDKVNGLLTVSSDRVKEDTAYYLLNEYVRKGNSKSRNRVFIVHRLDRDTSGVIMFAKTENAKHFLQTEWQEFSKKYLAVVPGKMAEKEGLITSYLTENSIHKMYSVADATKGKLAKTGYKVLKESTAYSLLEIDLITGRKNQIRVHLADKGHPVLGDKKYGFKEKGIKRLCLHSLSCTFIHPFSKEEMILTAAKPTYFDFIMKEKKNFK